MRRREFFLLLGGAALTWPTAGRAQQPGKVPRIAVLLPGTPVSFARRVKAFEDGLRERGYLDRTTIAIEWRWGQDSVRQLPSLAAIENVGLSDIEKKLPALSDREDGVAGELAKTA